MSRQIDGGNPAAGDPASCSNKRKERSSSESEISDGDQPKPDNNNNEALSDLYVTTVERCGFLSARKPSDKDLQIQLTMVSFFTRECRKSHRLHLKTIFNDLNEPFVKFLDLVEAIGLEHFAKDLEELQSSVFRAESGYHICEEHFMSSLELVVVSLFKQAKSMASVAQNVELDVIRTEMYTKLYDAQKSAPPKSLKYKVKRLKVSN